MQAEPRAALSLASREASHMLRLDKSDLILYSAKASTSSACQTQYMPTSVMLIVSGAWAGVCCTSHAGSAFL